METHPEMSTELFKSPIGVGIDQGAKFIEVPDLGVMGYPVIFRRFERAIGAQALKTEIDSVVALTGIPGSLYLMSAEGSHHNLRFGHAKTQRQRRIVN